jgi:hypothetical protein
MRYQLQGSMQEYSQDLHPGGADHLHGLQLPAAEAARLPVAAGGRRCCAVGRRRRNHHLLGCLLHLPLEPAAGLRSPGWKSRKPLSKRLAFRNMCNCRPHKSHQCLLIWRQHGRAGSRTIFHVADSLSFRCTANSDGSRVYSAHSSRSTLLAASRAAAAAAAFSCASRCASARAAEMRADTSALRSTGFRGHSS